MPYVERRNGAVVGVYANPQPGYAEEFLAAGHPDLAAFASSVPQEVSRFQAKEALRQAGLLDQADAAVAASNNATLQNAWANANTFKRSSPGINALAPAIGLDDAGLDALFTAAAGIVA